MQPIIDFGKRRKVPCSDCNEKGHCTMNCGPPLDLEKLAEAARSAQQSVRPKSRWA